MALTTSQLAALTRLFSSAVFQEMAKKGRSAIFARVLAQSGLESILGSRTTVGDAFDAAFAALSVSGFRDEYVYRAALVQKVLMGKHSLRTASMLNEFRAGKCKADLVILNGTATVYEIKSERDSLTRLANQVESYKKVFASVNVIASEDHVEAVLSNIPDAIGVMCLSKRYQISVIREALNQPEKICPLTVFESLRAVEATSILEEAGIRIPAVPNTLRHAALRTSFSKLPASEVHTLMVKTLKRTRNLAQLGELVYQLPKSLHAAALSIPVRRCEHQRLLDAVAMRLSSVMAWT